MELKWLEDFICLANSHSFRRSAEQRNISQPAFSRRIQALETWLGAALIDRSTYPTTLTETGRAFRETAEQALLLFQGARDEVRDQERRTRAVLRVSALHSIAVTFFPKWMSQWRAVFGPDQDFGVTRIMPDNFHDCVQSLVDGGCDLLLCYAHDAIPVLLDPQDYPSMKLAEETFLPVSASDDAGQPLYCLETGRDVPWLTYAPESYVWRIEDHILARCKPALPLHAICETPMGESLKAMALEGLGVTWLAHSTIRDDLDSGRLVAVGGPDLHFTADIRMYRSAHASRPQVTNFWSTIAAGTNGREDENVHPKT